MGPGIYGGIVKRDENGEVGRMMAVEIMINMMEMVMVIIEMVMIMMQMVMIVMFLSLLKVCRLFVRSNKHRILCNTVNTVQNIYAHTSHEFFVR